MQLSERNKTCAEAFGANVKGRYSGIRGATKHPRDRNERQSLFSFSRVEFAESHATYIRGGLPVIRRTAHRESVLPVTQVRPDGGTGPWHSFAI
jgi:hypothetical protein